MNIALIRTMDSQGRIVIPAEIRKQMKLSDGDALELENVGTELLLRKCPARLNGKESLYYMGCYGIGVSRTVAALYEYCLINDEKWGPCGFVLPENIAPYKVQIIPKVENEEKMKFANSVYSKLNNSGISCIIDDRENLTIGAKIKDSKVLGTPYIIVIGDKQEGEIIELEDNKKGKKESLTVEELIKKFSK